MTSLAVDGGTPVRNTLLPYGRQSISKEDIDAVVNVLRSDWLTTGPMVEAFEKRFAEIACQRHAVAVCNGTAALHAAVYALDIRAGDEAIVPTLTFAATANAVVFQGGVPVFADVDAGTLLIDPKTIERLITPRTRAIIAVDYAGQPCDYDALRAIAAVRNIHLMSDSCHALGATYHGRPAGSFSEVNVFSFHPVKHITTGEGGMAGTDNDEYARRMRVFRNHGITTDHRQRQERGGFFYEMVDLGYNYRLTDFQCALGLRQLDGLPELLARRRQIAARFDEAFSSLDLAASLAVRAGVCHAYHLYVLQLRLERLRVDRAQVIRALRAEGIGANVHYVPVHLHPYYRQQFGTAPGLCPVAEAAYDRLVSLPLFPGMSDDDVEDVIAAFTKVLGHYRR